MFDAGAIQSPRSEFQIDRIRYAWAIEDRFEQSDRLPELSSPGNENLPIQHLRNSRHLLSAKLKRRHLRPRLPATRQGESDRAELDAHLRGKCSAFILPVHYRVGLSRHRREHPTRPQTEAVAPGSPVFSVLRGNQPNFANSIWKGREGYLGPPRRRRIPYLIQGHLPVSPYRDRRAGIFNIDRDIPGDQARLGGFG